MARQSSTIEFNTFVKGLITEAGPLTFPDNASIDEDNWVLLKGGDRRRRLGMDFEANFEQIPTSQFMPSTGVLAYTSFLWTNAGGNPNLQILVVQVGNELSFIDRNEFPISDGLIHQELVLGLDTLTKLTYSSIDGKLVIASGLKDVRSYSIDSELNVTTSTFRLQVRDLFGVEDIAKEGYSLYSPQYLSTRPGELSEVHTYNLRNQTWGPSRLKSDAQTFIDPITEFNTAAISSGDSLEYDGVYLNGEYTTTEQYLGSIQGVGPDDPVPATWKTFTKGVAATGENQFVILSTLKLLSFEMKDIGGDANLEDLSEFTHLIWNGSDWAGTTGSALQNQGYPSNADNITPYLFENTAIGTGSKTVERFWPEDAAETIPGTAPAPRGYFVIDALDRGASRLDQVQALKVKYPPLAHEVTTLPVDSTQGGPTVVENFAGRVFYAGFPGDVEDGDNRSPVLSSYVMFSKLITGEADLGTCYQVGDPTSKEEADLVDTDGGFIKIDGAYGINHMINLGTSLLILAANGVWALSGGGDFGFTATTYLVNKISDHSVVGVDSVVLVDGGLYFWGIDGIYFLAKGEIGGFKVENISKNTIQSYYNDISDTDKVDCKGFYDSYDGKVRWLYGSTLLEGENAKELILDVELGAFYPSTIKSVSGGYPKPVSIVEVQPYKLGTVTEDVTYNGDNVLYNGEQVTYTSARRQDATRESMYITITSGNPINFTLSTYSDGKFRDWYSHNSVGVDAPAHLITGFISGGDFQRTKQVPYLTTHFTRTEDGFEEIGDDMVPTNQSSCLMRVRWDWSNSANSNRWGREFQAYRYRRYYMPANLADPYDTGFETITTKNRLRGKGKVLSLYFGTEPEKGCHIQGWSMLVGVNGNV